MELDEELIKKYQKIRTNVNDNLSDFRYKCRQLYKNNRAYPKLDSYIKAMISEDYIDFNSCTDFNMQDGFIILCASCYEDIWGVEVPFEVLDKELQNQTIQHLTEVNEEYARKKEAQKMKKLQSLAAELNVKIEEK
jgi:hypothetical protein